MSGLSLGRGSGGGAVLAGATPMGTCRDARQLTQQRNEVVSAGQGSGSLQPEVG